VSSAIDMHVISAVMSIVVNDLDAAVITVATVMAEPVSSATGQAKGSYAQDND
jgi:hypothetical protein